MAGRGVREVQRQPGRRRARVDDDDEAGRPRSALVGDRGLGRAHDRHRPVAQRRLGAPQPEQRTNRVPQAGRPAARPTGRRPGIPGRCRRSGRPRRRSRGTARPGSVAWSRTASRYAAGRRHRATVRNRGASCEPRRFSWTAVVVRVVGVQELLEPSPERGAVARRRRGPRTRGGPGPPPASSASAPANPRIASASG